MKSNLLWQLVFGGILQFIHSQQTSNASGTTWTSEANVGPTPVLDSPTELVAPSINISGSFLLSPSFMESTPTPTMNENVITIHLETPNQDDLLTLSLINATSSNHVDESMWITSDTQNAMLRDTYSPATQFPNQTINHFVLLSNDSAEEESDDGEIDTISPTSVSTSLTKQNVDSQTTPVAPTPTQTPQLVGSSIYNQTTDPEEDAVTEREIQNETKIAFVMKFQSDCITDDVNQSSAQNVLDKILRNSTTLGSQNFTIIISSNICERIISEIPVLLEETGQNVEEVFKTLKSLVGNTNITIETSGKSYVLTLVSVVAFNASRVSGSQKNKEMDEYLPYVIIGGVFGGILLIVLVLMCGKCLCSRCRKQKKPKKPDFEVPHLSLRPEDYILTRIPRPTTIYADNMAAPIMHDDVSMSSGQACYNGDQPHRQSFETSVVPMDEIRDDDPYYRYKQHEYLPHNNESSTELRTFNGKRLHHRSTGTDDAILYRNSYLSASTEKIHELNHRRSRDAMGVDNQAYMRA